MSGSRGKHSRPRVRCEYKAYEVKVCWRTGKVGYSSKSFAKKEAKRRNPGVTLYIYECTYCRNFHVSRQKHIEEGEDK